MCRAFSDCWREYRRAGCDILEASGLDVPGVQGLGAFGNCPACAPVTEGVLLGCWLHDHPLFMGLMAMGGSQRAGTVHA
jgi:hypothetical protein